MVARVRIGTVWDDTVAVLGGRSGAIASVSILALLVPTVVQSAVSLYMPEGLPRSALGFVVSVAAGVLAIWGALAVLALATHPSTDRAEAQRQATARLLPVIGVSIVLMLIVIALFVPFLIVFAATGFDIQAAVAAAQANTPALMPTPTPSALWFTLLYGLALGILSVWASARLMLINPVLLNERVGLGAIRRSVVLTRGLTWKLIGVLILFGIVVVVAVFAAQSVTGLVFRLILGSDNVATALFLASIVAAAITTAFTALAYVFTARLYVATHETPTPA